MFRKLQLFPSILNVFSVNASFRRDFQRNFQDPIQMPNIAKRNSNVHFILGNTGHMRGRLTLRANRIVSFIVSILSNGGNSEK